jgi:hypothetical protein
VVVAVLRSDDFCCHRAISHCKCVQAIANAPRHAGLAGS